MRTLCREMKDSDVSVATGAESVRTERDRSMEPPHSRVTLYLYIHECVRSR